MQMTSQTQSQTRKEQIPHSANSSREDFILEMLLICRERESLLEVHYFLAFEI